MFYIIVRIKVRLVDLYKTDPYAYHQIAVLSGCSPTNLLIFSMGELTSCK